MKQWHVFVGVVSILLTVIGYCFSMYYRIDGKVMEVQSHFSVIDNKLTEIAVDLQWIKKSLEKD